MSIEPMPGRGYQPGDRMPPELRWFGPDGILRGALWPSLTARFRRPPERPAETCETCPVRARLVGALAREWSKTDAELLAALDALEQAERGS